MYSTVPQASASAIRFMLMVMTVLTIITLIIVRIMIVTHSNDYCRQI